ncbi:tetraacyldisaccharide 4'-kinase [Legionella spiritensis]|uniref:Tetraacyldisaccharide 4'-kinase n=1 Tax=Legionella spiritensis TaxID=452 RepID=A0A0W0YWY5_LEGSP|nr:tetraacyldisaccharide 4'-kinase [Legionella spiritensis]KTD61402.1 tetraacyldisaccharide 4'-kinase [Legionella spiritensis]SNV33501.1 tetraacyldisaccharide 4'-kinase [Legionella spiritensis]VEG92395.1 tetraacyldisaccharide 4'-kinase [Legionella spiritensis]
MLLNLEKLWYGRHPGRWLLVPAAMIYRIVITLRRFFLRTFRQQQFSVPVIVVGNLSVGGAGKTPLVIALAKQLSQKGLRVGIVSRGYGAQIRSFPHEVMPDDLAETVGDEPLLLANKTGCPVVIAPMRVDAVHFLLDNYDSQIIISDDGLQHYKMGRAIEIVVIDGVRGMGNGWCLPAGPLREPVSRLKEADFLVVNGGEWPGAYPMTLRSGRLTHLVHGREIGIEELRTPVAAVAGIGNPQRFFTSLKQLGMSFQPVIFPDHHLYKASDLTFSTASVVMTEKDAVKCRSFAGDAWYFLPVEAVVSELFWQALWAHKQLKRLAFT